MADSEKIKAAFMLLLGGFQADMSDYNEFGYCDTPCPLRAAYRNNATCLLAEREDCSEAIFNWYMEKINEQRDSAQGQGAANY